MGELITIKQVIEEIKHIPENRLTEIYDFLHFFRLGLQQPKGAVKETMKFAGCWSNMPDEVFDDFLDDIKQRRKLALSRRRHSERGIS